MTTAITVFEDEQQLGGALAGELASRLSAGGRFVLGSAAGRSPTSTMRALAGLVPAEADLSQVIVVMMDEYVHWDGGDYRPIAPDLPHSCRGYALREILAPLNATRSAGAQIPPENLWVPDPGTPERYDDDLDAVGGIDVFVVASGASDGHVGFHGPGAASTGRTSVVALAESTRADNLRTFPSLRGIDDVPRFGVTVGLGTIIAHSREVVMVMHGRSKARSAAIVAAAQAYDPAWPATFIHECPRPRILLDRAAAGNVQPQDGKVTP